MKYLLAAMILLVSSVVSAGVTIKYMEHAVFMTVARADKVAKVICLENKLEEQAGLSGGWKLMTCSGTSAAVRWQLCYVNIDKRSFLCGQFKPT